MTNERAADHAREIIRILGPYLSGQPKSNKKPTMDELMIACMNAQMIAEHLEEKEQR